MTTRNNSQCNSTFHGCPSIEIMDGQKRHVEMHNKILTWLTDNNTEWAYLMK